MREPGPRCAAARAGAVGSEPMPVLRRWILAAVQVRALRRLARRPGLWLLANALGWALGMPPVFAGIRALALHGPRPGVLLGCAAALLGAGALIGLVEGLFLVRMLGDRFSATFDI